MKEAALESQLDLIETHVQLAKEDLESGDLGRVEAALKTIAYVSSQVAEDVSEGQVTTAPRRGVGGRPKSEKSKRLGEGIVQILKSKGAPVNIGDLMDELKAEGLDLPGAGKPANLIAHMRRMPEVRRVRRGFYGLTSQ